MSFAHSLSPRFRTASPGPPRFSGLVAIALLILALALMLLTLRG